MSNSKFMKEAGHKKKTDNKNSKSSNDDMLVEELFRNYNVSTELIKKSTDLDELLDTLLKEYNDRFDEIPGVDLVNVDQLDDKCLVKEKLRSFVMFASHAIVLKENAEVFHNLEESNKNLYKAKIKLEKQNNLLEQMNQQYLNMLGFVSHELRNPLISILGFAELLDEELLGELKTEQKKAVSVIIRSSRLLIEMIKNYLDLANIEQGDLVIDKKRFDLHKDILSFVLEEMTEQYNRKELNVWVETDLDSIVVDCDSGLMRVVFNNLLSNAVKYSNQGGNVVVEMVRKEDNFEISVLNTGQGVKRNQLKNLFKKFTRIESENQLGMKSSGLGLYNAKHIIKKHGGSIWVDTEYGKYFKVSFSLPVCLEAMNPIIARQAVG